MSAKPAGPESLAQNNQPALPQTTTGMRKAKAGNNRFGFFNQNPSTSNNPNIQPGFLPGYDINPTTGRAYVKTKDGLQAINDQGVEESAPEAYILPISDALSAIKLGLSAGKLGINLLGDLAESTLPAVKKGTTALAKRMGFWAGDPEQLAIRNHVLANIEQSQAASSASSFPIHLAKEDQLLSGYNADEWTMIHLKKGDIVYGGLPGPSRYYTTEETALNSKGSKDIFSQSLQIHSHPNLGYRSDVGIYQIMQDMSVPKGIARANPHLGVGESEQFFINNYKSQKAIQLIEQHELGEFYEYRMQTNKLSY
jgi:hypothetical protein